MDNIMLTESIIRTLTRNGAVSWRHKGKSYSVTLTSWGDLDLPVYVRTIDGNRETVMGLNGQQLYPELCRNLAADWIRRQMITEAETLSGRA